ncbi:hypothetical protein B0T14DRAFT_431559 [Immersiella caudata]|uniref:Uncharacterized protein n=1 Tax=Immersiella caudata TaxID=314043 RepID=A0AA40BZS2_9PEZI|nr:hypothetical protein B0T14DRAFT_431559 [Immersiella caudata]
MIVTTFLFELLEDWVIIFLDLGSTIETVVEFLGTVPSLTILAGYILARTYLVVESFVSLRAEPVGVFWTPAWLQMIPHL